MICRLVNGILMNPICFHIGQRPIYWYGVMVAVAFLACLAHLNLAAKKERRPAAFVSDLVFWIMIGAILGARLAYVAANWSEFAAAPGHIFRVDQGGLIYYGGLVGAALATVVFARVKREPLLALWDFIATALPLGHAIGRIGCFLNGCCYGALACWLPWSVNTQDGPRHPVQLYEAAFNLALFAFVNLLYPRRDRDGRVAALYLMLYPLGRFVMEYFRGDDRLRYLGLNVAQEISLALIGGGVALWLLAPRRAAAGTGVQP